MNNIHAWLRRAFDSGALQILKHSRVSFSSRARLTIAEVNAGATLVSAPGVGFALRLVNSRAISVGGAAAAVTTVDVLGTVGASVVKLVAYGQAALTRSTVLTPGISGATVLADGASFVQLDDNTAITAGKTGSNVTTATHIDFETTFVIVKTA